ncbi:MAG: hypothetical protein NVV82_19870 [Sporocytophaga sp.]|nr:hypothetical protein [Sporocytophaga sp.]
MKKKHLLFFILFMQTLFFKSHAAKFTVTNSGDNVVGGLRYLLDNAGSGDTIVFAQTLVGATITLSSNIIVIDKDITIIGPGEDKLSVSNSLTSTLFNIEPFANVFIKGIKILSCGDYDQILQNDVSGAIYNQGNLTLKQVTFNDNQTGAIYNKGTIYMERVTLYANYTQGDRYPGRASGLFNRGTATIKECIFDYNISDGSSVNPTGIRNSGTMYIEKNFYYPRMVCRDFCK